MILGFRFLQISTSASSNNLASLDPGGRAWNAPTIAGSRQGAIVSRALGRQPQAPVSPILRKLWTDTATAWGHLSSPACCTFRRSAAVQHAITDLYYAVHALEKKQAWRSAVKAAFGKMEYLVPSAALLTHLCAARLVCKISSAAMMP